MLKPLRVYVHQSFTAKLAAAPMEDWNRGDGAVSSGKLTSKLGQDGLDPCIHNTNGMFMVGGCTPCKQLNFPYVNQVRSGSWIDAKRCGHQDGMKVPLERESCSAHKHTQSLLAWVHCLVLFNQIQRHSIPSVEPGETMKRF